MFTEALTPITEKTVGLIRRRFPFVVFIALSGLSIFIWQGLRFYKQAKFKHSLRVLIPQIKPMSLEEREVFYSIYAEKNCHQPCDLKKRIEKVTEFFEEEIYK